jgi:hypothetical protein
MTVYGEVDELKRFAEAIKPEDPNDVSEWDNDLGPDHKSATIFRNLVPFPENGHKPMTHNGESLGTAFADPEKDGSSFIDGYQWCIDNWGCKWGDCSTRFTEHYDGEVTYLQFDYETPWGPANFTKISDLFPSLSFVITFEEGGMGFCGSEAYYGGDLAYEGGASHGDSIYPEPDSYDDDGEFDGDKYDAWLERMSLLLELFETNAEKAVGMSFSAPSDLMSLPTRSG